LAITIEETNQMQMFVLHGEWENALVSKVIFSFGLHKVLITRKHL